MIVIPSLCSMLKTSQKGDRGNEAVPAGFHRALHERLRHGPVSGTALVPLDRDEPRTIAEHFRTRTPDSFQLLTTVVFEYNSRTVSGIGTVQIKSAESVFRIAAMNPWGEAVRTLRRPEQRNDPLFDR